MATRDLKVIAAAEGRQGDMTQAVRELQDLYTAAAAQPWSYEWLPITCVAVLVHLISACMLRPPGKFSAALAQLQAGLQLVNESLTSDRIDLQVRLEESPPPPPPTRAGNLLAGAHLFMVTWHLCLLA